MLPLFVPCLLVGMLVGNLMALVPFVRPVSHTAALSLVSEFALGVFLAVSLMALQLWALAGMAGTLLAVLAVQTAMALAFSYFLVFRLLGRDYPAAVLTAGYRQLRPRRHPHRHRHDDRRHQALRPLPVRLHRAAAGLRPLRRPRQRPRDPGLPEPLDPLMPDLLLELFSEEIPARMQPKAAADLRRLVTDGLVERGLTYAHAAAFATPRRLTLALEGLAERSPAPPRGAQGPPRRRAPPPPSKASSAPPASPATRSRPAPTRRATSSSPSSSAPAAPPPRSSPRPSRRSSATSPGRSPCAGATAPLRWVRPLHSILCILVRETGAEVVPFAIDGIAAGDTTRGHRFHAPHPFRVASFDDYVAKLERAHVILDPAERAARIAHDAQQLAFASGLELDRGRGPPRRERRPHRMAGHAPRPHRAPLPRPAARGAADLDAREPEVLLPPRPRPGAITAYLLVANRETADHGATIAAGNARVLTARLADAEFFWQNDLRTPLAEMAAKLATVTFHNKLGTQADRIDRIAALARELAPAVGADPDLAERAARLAKADLASQMVYEFPELQGTMGRYYAERAGEDPAVAAAAEEHYSPLGPSDAVPTAPVSVAVALADKLDTLTGFWAIDEKPTGSKDPFALRRAALGVIRIVLETERLPLMRLLDGHSRRSRIDVTCWTEHGIASSG